MPLHFRLLLLLLLAMLTLAAGGCSSTKISEKWKAEDVHEPRAKKILLLSLIKDPVVRAYFEDHFVEEAKRKGFDVVPSHLLAPNPTDMDEEEEVRRMVRESGADGVLVAQLRGVQKKYKFVPSRLDWYPDSFYHSGFYNYYYMSYRSIYRPGYIGSDDYFKMQFRYFSTRSEKLIWAGNVETKNPRSISGTVQEIADEVLDSLRGAGLI
jgi:ABC-type glycerol-3-phosphate transport system substrate-binding protein